jgi:hypothetical protein
LDLQTQILIFTHHIRVALTTQRNVTKQFRIKMTKKCNSNDSYIVIVETARLSLKKKQVKKSTKRKNNKRWYDRSLQELRMSVDHYSRLLSFNLYNSHLRQKCFQLNSKYNRERKRKRRTYFQTIMNKIDDLEESNPKMFWKLLTWLP